MNRPYAAMPDQPGRPPAGRGRTVLLVVGGIVGFVIVAGGLVAAFGGRIAVTEGGESTDVATNAATNVTTGGTAKVTAAANAVAATAPPPAGQDVVFSCTGQADDGVDITYGPEGSELGASSLPFSKSLPLNPGAPFYVTAAQLQGSGSVSCSTVVNYQDSNGTVHIVTQSAAVAGGHGTASAEVCSDLTGGWQVC